MIRLKDACTGQARKLIERLPNNSQAYRSARKLLEEAFGGIERDVQRHLLEARDQPTLRSNDREGIRSFRNFVRSLVSTLESTASESELGQGSLYIVF
jgi:hypothetical protein